MLRRARGAVVRRGERSLIATKAGTPVLRLVGFPLEDLAGGDYELVLQVEDKTSGRTAERVETFRIEGAVGS